MEVVQERVEKCQQVFSWYQEELADIKEIRFMPELIGSMGNRWLTALTLDHTDPQVIIQKLSQNNIESRLLWKPMHMQELFKDAPSETNGVSEELFSKGLCLPSGTDLSRDDVRRVCTSMKEVL
jgi:UDP-N-acetylbacillosamine transaminase